MPTHLMIPDGIEPTKLLELKQLILKHNYVGNNLLNGSFSKTQGFSIIFTRDGMAEVIDRFPFLKTYFERIDLWQGVNDLQAWYRRFWRPVIPNAFYVNLLLVPSGESVGRHVDGTLQPLVQIEGLTPRRVSVLWVHIPEGMTGGELLLYQGREKIASIAPKEGTIVHFQGDLGHEVSIVKTVGMEDSQRVSLVCEQYVVPDKELEKIPSFKIKSTVNFAAFLRQASTDVQQ